MRKVTTLLALGCAVCSTAFAGIIPGTKLDTDDFRLSEESKQIMNTMNAMQSFNMVISDLSMTVSSDKVMKKTYTDNTYIWTYSFYKNEEVWANMLIDNKGNHPTFEEMPYYWVTCYLTAQRKNDEGKGNVTNLQFQLMWPSMYVWEDFINDQDNHMKPEEKNLEMVGFNQMFEANPKTHGKDFYYTGEVNLFYGDDAKTFLTGWPIAPNAWAGGDGWNQLYNNAQTYLKAEGSQFCVLSLEDVDVDTESYQIGCQLFFENGSKLNLDYDGTIRANGFVPRHYDIEMKTKPIIVNMGEQSSASLDLDNPWGTGEWGPFTKFWFACGLDDCEAVMKGEKTALYDKWNDVFGFTNPQQRDDSFGFIFGGFFKEPGATNPYGWYDLVDPNIEYSDRGDYVGNDMIPRLHQLAPIGYDDEKMPWSDTDMTDALGMVMGSYYVFLQPYTRVCFGDKKEGFWMSGIDAYRNTYKFSYKGDMTYYPDSMDLSKVETIPAVYDIDAVEGIAAEKNAFIVAQNGVITVAPAADAEVVVYTLSGARVASANVAADNVVRFNVDKGMYIVKAGKTAQKVVL